MPPLCPHFPPPRDLFHEVVLLLGHYSLLHPAGQELARYGEGTVGRREEKRRLSNGMVAVFFFTFTGPWRGGVGYFCLSIVSPLP